jgi:hypothetical protein
LNHLSAGSASPCRLRVAVVAPIIAEGDGTSSAIRDTIRAASSEAAWRASVFVRANEYPEIAAHRVEDAGELRRRPEFAVADVIIYLILRLRGARTCRADAPEVPVFQR